MSNVKIVPGTGGNQYVPYDARTGNESIVYFTRDISPEGIRKIYQRVKANLVGKIGIFFFPVNSYIFQLNAQVVIDIVCNCYGIGIRISVFYKQNHVIYKHISGIDIGNIYILSI